MTASRKYSQADINQTQSVLIARMKTTRRNSDKALSMIDESIEKSFESDRIESKTTVMKYKLSEVFEPISNIIPEENSDNDGSSYEIKKKNAEELLIDDSEEKGDGGSVSNSESSYLESVKMKKWESSSSLNFQIMVNKGTSEKNLNAL